MLEEFSFNEPTKKELTHDLIKDEILDMTEDFFRRRNERKDMAKPYLRCLGLPDSVQRRTLSLIRVRRERGEREKEREREIVTGYIHAKH